MKAILRNNRKVIVDVEPICYFKDEMEYDAYKDKGGNIYFEDEIELKEYYGG